MSNKEEDEIQEALLALQLGIRNKIEKGMDVSDPRITSQTPRIYKWWCWFWWDHVCTKEGVCLRCGKKIPVIKTIIK